MGSLLMTRPPYSSRTQIFVDLVKITLSSIRKFMANDPMNAIRH